MIHSDYTNIKVCPCLVNKDFGLRDFKNAVAHTVQSVRVDEVWILALQALCFVTFETVRVVQLTTIALV